MALKQACTFVKKATVDFKVRYFSIIHIQKVLICLPVIFTNNAYTSQGIGAIDISQQWQTER